MAYRITSVLLLLFALLQVGCNPKENLPSTFQVCADSSESIFPGIVDSSSNWILLESDSCIKIILDSKPSYSSINPLPNDTSGLKRILGPMVFDHIYGHARWPYKAPKETTKIPVWSQIIDKDTVVKSDFSGFENKNLPLISIRCDSLSLFGPEGVYAEGKGLPRLAGLIRIDEAAFIKKNDSLIGSGTVETALVLGSEFSAQEVQFRIEINKGFGSLFVGEQRFDTRGFQTSNSSFSFVIIDQKQLPNYRADNDLLQRVFEIPRSRLEKQASVEFYDQNKSLKQHVVVGLGTSGNLSASFPQKGFNFYFRKDSVRLDWFRIKEPIDLDQLRVRAGGSGSQFGRLNHIIANRMASSIGLHASLDNPVHVFLNGEYWGIYSLQEKLNSKYYKRQINSQVKVKEITYPHPQISSLDIVDAERPDHLFTEKQKPYLQWTTEQLKTGNPRDLYQFLGEQYFFDYIFHHTYLNNQDWLKNQNNILAISDSSNRRLTHLVIDQDDSFNTGNEALNEIFQGPFEDLKLCKMFRVLMTNDSLQAVYIRRCIQHMQGAYDYQHSSVLVESVYDLYQPFLTSFNEERWGIYNPDTQELENQKVSTLEFLENRNKAYVELLSELFPDKRDLLEKAKLK